MINYKSSFAVLSQKLINTTNFYVLVPLRYLVQLDIFMQNYYQLEGSGFVFSLTHFLWLHDPLLKVQPSFQVENVPSVNIPDTIQIHRAQPIFWYFSRGGRVLRKGKERLKKPELKAHYEGSKQEIVTVWIYHKKDVEHKVFFEYLNLEQTLALIDSNDVDLNGYLQDFIYPKGLIQISYQGKNNFIIRAVWSENMCLLDHITNIHPINSNKINLYQRLITFECNSGPIKQESLNGTVLPQQIEVQLGNIATHIKNVTNEKRQVRQMEVLFKVDRQNRLILLFCQFLKLKDHYLHYEDETDDLYVKNLQTTAIKQTLKAPIHNLAEKISTKYLSQAKSNMDLELKDLCITCEENKINSDFLEVRMKELIEDWQIDHHGAEDLVKQKLQLKLSAEKKGARSVSKTPSTADGSEIVKQNVFSSQANQNYLKIKIQKRYQIPPVVRKIYPHMSEEDYQEIKGNEAFLNQPLMICTDCFLKKLTRCRIEELDLGPYFLFQLRGTKKPAVNLTKKQQDEMISLKLEKGQSTQQPKHVRKYSQKSLAPLLLSHHNKMLNIDNLIDLRKSDFSLNQPNIRSSLSVSQIPTNSLQIPSSHQSYSNTPMAQLYQTYNIEENLNNLSGRAFKKLQHMAQKFKKD